MADKVKFKPFRRPSSWRRSSGLRREKRFALRQRLKGAERLVLAQQPGAMRLDFCFTAMPKRRKATPQRDRF
jgi:hypothetical protein